MWLIYSSCLKPVKGNPSKLKVSYLENNFLIKKKLYAYLIQFNDYLLST